MKPLYTLPDLSYGYGDLAPHISEEQLKIHHTKHHQGYVDGANKIFEMLEDVRKKGTEYDVKNTLKELSFHIAGHQLHNAFWNSMAPEGTGGEPGEIGKRLEEKFGSLDRFKDEFTKAAASVEGSGWAALGYCKKLDMLEIMQIEKHNVNVYPQFKLIMSVDVWEHAYYLDYKNERGKFIEAFWNVVNWNGINERLKKYSK